MPWAPRRMGTFALVELLDVGDRLGTGDLPGVQVLDEEAAVRVGPERPVVEVAGADRVDLDAVGDHLEGEGLDQADAAELRARVGGVLVRADQAGLELIWMMSVSHSGAVECWRARSWPRCLVTRKKAT